MSLPNFVPQVVVRSCFDIPSLMKACRAAQQLAHHLSSSQLHTWDALSVNANRMKRFFEQNEKMFEQSTCNP